MTQAKKTYEDLEQHVIKKVRDEAGELVCKQVIRNLRRMPTTVPEDNELGLYTLWNSVCYKMQVQQSFLFDLYLIDVDKQVEHFTRQLPEYQVIAVWLSSNDAFELLAEYDDDIENKIDAVVKRLRNDYLLETAKSWTNKNIRKAINTISSRFY